MAEASCDAKLDARLDVAVSSDAPVAKVEKFGSPAFTAARSDEVALSSALVQPAVVANSAKLGKSAASAYELVADSRVAIRAACVAILELVVANCELREDVAPASDALSSAFAATTAELSCVSVAYCERSASTTSGHALLQSPAMQSVSVAVVEAFWYATLVMVEVAVSLRIESTRILSSLTAEMSGAVRPA